MQLHLEDSSLQEIKQHKLHSQEDVEITCHSYPLQIEQVKLCVQSCIPESLRQKKSTNRSKKEKLKAKEERPSEPISRTDTNIDL